MNVKKLNEAIEALKEDVGDGLVACDIFTVADGMSIASYNPQPLNQKRVHYLIN